MKNDVIVIGIDPAPAKESTVLTDTDLPFDNSDMIKRFIPRRLNPIQLLTFIKSLKEHSSKILICWDAPLIISDKYSNIRRIEKFFQNDYFPIQKNNTGVSVLSYTGCSHWAITRHILGLPIIGKFDRRDIPFELIKDEKEKGSVNKSVVEVHPAVAMYFWLGGKLEKYKRNKKEVIGIWKELKTKINVFSEISFVPKNDDELDAVVAYVLGNEWLQDTGSVKLLGNESTGSILLPFEKELFEAFEDFSKSLI
jgi:predicted RNase H-like nuclease